MSEESVEGRVSSGKGRGISPSTPDPRPFGFGCQVSGVRNGVTRVE
jgi:hypothetical protein